MPLQFQKYRNINSCKDNHRDKKFIQHFQCSLKWRACPTWQDELEQNIWFTDLTIREAVTSQAHGPSASEARVQRCNVWGITGKSRFGPVKSQGSWKLFTCTNLVDPYFELRSADMASSKLSFLIVLRKDKRLIKKKYFRKWSLEQASTFLPQTTQISGTTVPFLKLLQIFWSWPMNATFVNFLDGDKILSGLSKQFLLQCCFWQMCKMCC